MIFALLTLQVESETAFNMVQNEKGQMHEYDILVLGSIAH